MICRLLASEERKECKINVLHRWNISFVKSKSTYWQKICLSISRL